jgi:hypothetical protein
MVFYTDIILDVFRYIEIYLDYRFKTGRTGGLASSFHAAQSCGTCSVIPESVLVEMENKSRTRQYHTMLMLARKSLPASGGRKHQVLAA